MKQHVFIYLLSLSIVIPLFFSCDDDEKSDFEKKENVAQKPSDGSPKSAEEQKGVLETTGISMNAELTDAMKSESMKKCASFAHFLSDMEGSSLESNYKSFKKTKAFEVVLGAAKVKNKEKKVTEYLTDIKKVEEEPESLHELQDSLSGKYTWNANTQSWDYAESDKIIFEFPSSVDGTSNNASFVVENVNDTKLKDYYYFGDNSWVEESDDAYTGYVPTGLSFYFEVEESKIMEFDYSAAFNDYGAPENITVEYKLDPLSYKTEFINNGSKEIFTTTTLKKGETKLLEIGAGINGDLTQDNINNSIRYYAYNEETYRDTLVSAEDTANYDYYYPEPDPKKLFKDGFAYISMMDKIKVGGKVQIKDLIAAEKEIYPENYYDNPDFDKEQATEDWANALNEHTDLYMANMEENTWMAQAEFYKKSEESDYDDETYYYVDMRLKFSDDSKVDPETYFGGEGFDELMQEFENSMDEVESAYSDYNF